MIFFSHHSIAGWAYNQRQPAWITGSADRLSDWLVVSLPYSGVYCVNAGLGVIRSTEQSVKVEHMARDGNPLVLWYKASSVKWVSGQVGRVEAPHRSTLKSNITESTLSPSRDSSFVFWSPVYAYSICIFLPWLIMKKIYLFFVTVLWCAITHVFLHTVNILWILLLKRWYWEVDNINKKII